MKTRPSRRALPTSVCVTLLAVCIRASAQPLPDCTINFDVDCPDTSALCGATFSGGDGCRIEGLSMCYSSGGFSFKVTPTMPAVIELSGDLLSLEVFFAAEGSALGTMRFFDAVSGGQEVGSPLATNGDCLVSHPPKQLVSLAAVVRRIEVTATDGTVWIDDFHVNPLPTCTDPCDDGDACTINDACSNGVCVGGPAADCDDGNACTDDSCDAATGCLHPNNAAACDDGNVCTTQDVCTSGTCSGTPVAGCVPCSTVAECDDGNACTDDACDAATGCMHTDNSADCDDADVCTDDSCDAATGCVHSNNTATCDDGNVCTTADVCTGGICSGAPVAGCVQCLTDAECDDGDVCTDDSCDAATECVHTNNTAACDDADVCTTADVCTGGTCSGTPVAGCVPCSTDVECDDGDVCTDDSCNATTGCMHTNNTTACNDGDVCTTADACTNGICSGTPVAGCVPCSTDAECDDGDVCTDDSCDAETGCVHTNTTTSCDDGNACTTADVCAGGTCSGTPVAGCVMCSTKAECDDGDSCTEDACDNRICSNEPISACVDQESQPPPAPDDTSAAPDEVATDPLPNQNEPSGATITTARPFCGLFGTLPLVVMVAGLWTVRIRRHLRIDRQS